MSGQRLARSTVVAAMGAWMGAGTILLGPAPPASAEPCPDVEVVFARGTDEPPGVGGVGLAFVDAVRAQAGGRSVGVYAANYPASSNFADRMAFASTVVDGVRDAGARVQLMAANCPNTRLILGGYSQGAAVSGFVTAAVVPAGVPAELVPKPLPPDVAEHVAAVVLFGKPSGEFVSNYDAPSIDVGPLYAGKTLELCAQGDTICEQVPEGGPTFAHVLYPVNGMVGEGAAFAVSRL